MSSATPPADKTEKEVSLVIGVTPGPKQETVTARKAGGLVDMMLPVSPTKVAVSQALENLAKAINLAFQSDFLETELDKVYKAARVADGAVQIMHHEYIGLGDGLFASIGRTAKSFELSLRGPDPASPEGKEQMEKASGSKPIRGFFNLLGRKLNFLQEFEDKAPTYVEQMLDRLEAARMIVGWSRSEWSISTTLIGLDVIIRPCAPAGG